MVTVEGDTDDTAATRPPYVHCALTGMFNGPDKRVYETWCDRKVGGEFTFTDASHAALNARQGGYLLLCPKCSAAIQSSLASGTWDGTLTQEEESDDDLPGPIT